MTSLQIVGRRSSHFTRIARIFAEELGLSYEVVPIYDMTAQDSAIYANNPALKLPILRSGEDVVFGTENICRAMVERAQKSVAVVWPEQLRGNVSRNAQELVWHCMATQVQLVMGTVVNKLPADNPYFAKARAGFERSLQWLDANLAAALSALPPSRDLSLFEVALHCLVEHLTFRATLPVDAYASLAGFCNDFAKRPSAQRTVYRFDKPPVHESGHSAATPPR